MQRNRLLLILILAAAILAPAASASVVFSIAPITTQVHPGDINDAFQVLLMNSSGADISVAGFSFGVTTTNTDITFQSADTQTTDQYIFAGDSFDVINTIPLSFSSPGQSLVGLDNTNDGAGITVANGQAVGLGRVLFDVSPTAVPLTPFTIDFSTNPGDNSLSGTGANAISFSFSSGGQTVTITPATPEPATLLLAPAGLLLLLLRRHRG
jgi:hypothetical protein